MALTLRLPRWDSHAATRLAQAGIDVTDPPHGYVGHGIEVHLEVPDEDPVNSVAQALRGWTVLLPGDFAGPGQLHR
jgi:hypothetical protein